jgi:rfaE bifunctional protein nucleotidyltransferase chain/domain
MPTPSPHGKILSHAQLLAARRAAREAGQKLVHCHGCFDIVHPGHIRHLRQARSHGDLLLVTISGDAQVKKGTGRPLIPEELRAENLAALDCVDMVYIEQRPTAAELLAEVQPDVFVKGREYETNSDPRFAAERAAVESAGGRIVFSSGDVVFSSTALISMLEHSVDPFQARLVQLLESDELAGPALFSLISSFRNQRVLIIGEPILDTYILCDRPEVAGESPVMTLRPIERRQYDGGAAIIARHLAALGARPTLITPLPLASSDPAAAHVAESLRRRLTAEGIEVRILATDKPVCEKQRFLVGAQKVMKLDLLEPLVLDGQQQDQLLAMVQQACEEAGADASAGELTFAAAIIADFGQGLFTPALLGRLCKLLRPRVRTLSGDVSGRRANLRAMQTMDLLCPSESELREALGAWGGGRSLPTVVWELLQETHSTAAMITMGPEGLIAFDPLAEAQHARGFESRLRAQHVPSLTPYAIDALGCGDSLLAAATLSLASGGSLLAAGFLGSVAAAVQAQRIGNIPISAADLRQGIVKVQASHLTYTPHETIPARREPIPVTA